MSAEAGFAIVPDVISRGECAAILAELLSSRVGRGRAGTRSLMANSSVAAMAHDPRLTSITADYVGGSALPFRATLFEKTGEANWLIAWHQDTGLPLVEPNDDPAWGPWTRKHGQLHAIAPAWALSRVVALRLHLDDSTSLNGPLRVIPRSHVYGIVECPSNRAVADSIVECLVPCGGLVAMRPLLIHASSKAVNDQPRRVLHIEYTDSLELAPGIRLAVA